ncbi:phospholipid-binding lipoprotein MlaA [Idiomarina aquatica]|uniref:Phospholipid-binding lipoprotein MlaA n=1 Tax=Idiomarina aquatica TaxID=1327752 RepID=A0A4R6P1Z6_9GAMM|nr:VacJ family lipoprotein [Idiomarina aquatica]TDP31275.1 phospholipid-binding lipoprotein MlaA [Idiomarina aquatica]
MQKTWYAKLFGALMSVLVLAGCSSTPDDPYADKRDPFEDMNRVVWDFNQDVDEAVIKPTAEAYENVPEPVRNSLYRAFENLQEPWSFVNNILQGKPKDAGITVGRFFFNSTIGLLGLLDPATEMGLTKREESLGETLALWGVPDGPYLMLPLLGPTVLIDRGTDWVDGNYFPYTEVDSDWDIPRYTVKGLELRLRLRDQEQVLENSLDPYTFVKEAYYQNWRYNVYDGNPPQEPAEDFEDFEDF